MLRADLIEPGTVDRRHRRANAAGGGIKAHLPHPLALVGRKVQPLVAPEARAIVHLVRLPACGSIMRPPQPYSMKKPDGVRM